MGGVRQGVGGPAAPRALAAPPGSRLPAATTRVVAVCVHGGRPGAAQTLRAAVSTQAPPPDQVLDLQIVEVRIGGGADAAPPAAVHLPRPRGASPTETVAVPAAIPGDGAGAPSASGVLREAAGSSPAAVVQLAAGTRLGVAVAAGLARIGGPPREGYVWLLDDGALPAPDALRTLLACARLDPGAAVLGPKLRVGHPGPSPSGSPSGSILLEAGVSVDRAGRRYTGVRPGEIDRGQRDGVRDVLTVASSGMLIRAAAWRLLDGLDPELDGGHDIDLGWRAARAGLRVVVVPMATMTARAEAVPSAGAAAPAPDGAPAGSRHRQSRRDLWDRRAWVPADRAGALRVRLANTAWPLLPGAGAAILVAALPRALGLVSRGRLRSAAIELALPFVVLGRLRQLARMRRRAGRTRAVSHHAIRSLLPARLRRRPGSAAPSPEVGLLDVGAGELSARHHVPVGVGGLVATPPGRRSTRAAVLLACLLGVVGVVAMRGMPADMLGAGLPLPAGARDLWTAVWSGRVGTAGAPLDGTGPPPPWTALLAAAASLLGGRPAAAGWLLLAAGPALAGLTAHRALARLGPRPAARFGLAAAYGASPVMTGAVAAGRSDTVGALILLPAVLAATDSVLRGCAGLVGGRLRAIWLLAVCLVGFVACAPSMAPLVWIGLPAAALLAVRRRLPDIAAALPVTIIPLIPTLYAGGAGIRAEPLAALARFPQDSIALVAGAGERPKAAVVGFLAGCLICWLLGRWSGRAGSDQAGPGRAGRIGWSLAALGLLAVLLTSRLAGDADQRVAGGEGWWAGPQYGLVLAGALLAAASVCRPARAPRRRREAPGAGAGPGTGRLARIVVFPVTALILVGSAGLAAGHLAAGPGWRASPTAWSWDSAIPADRAGSLDRAVTADDAGGAATEVTATEVPWSGTGPSAMVRAVQAEARTAPAGSSLLVLYRSDRSGLIRYILAAADGPRFPAGQARPPRRAATFLADVVADLAVGGDQAAGWLPLLGVAAIAVPAMDASADLITRLDATPSLLRDRARPGVLLWRPATPDQAVPTPASRRATAAVPPAFAVDSDLQPRAAPPDPTGSSTPSVPLVPSVVEPLPAAPTTARRLPPGGCVAALPGAARAPQRDLILAAPAGAGWRAWLNGRPLRPFAAWGWAAGFRLPAEGGTVRLYRDDGRAHELVLAQAAALGALLLLGIAAARRSRRSPPDTDAPPIAGPSGRDLGRAGRGSGSGSVEEAP